MKTIGIIGGIGVPATVKYYEWINAGIQRALGGQHSAKIVITSLNGEDVRKFREAQDDDGEGAFYANQAKALQRAGADCVLIASNTSHKNAPYIKQAVSIPLLHLAEATAHHVRSIGLKTVGLIGTAYTMNHDFYTSKLESAGARVILPNTADRVFCSNEIYNHLVKNEVRPNAEAEYACIAQKLVKRGAESIILGCTELTLLNISEQVSVPLIDTVRIHVDAAIRFALS